MKILLCLFLIAVLASAADLGWGMCLMMFSHTSAGVGWAAAAAACMADVDAAAAG